MFNVTTSVRNKKWGEKRVDIGLNDDDNERNLIQSLKYRSLHRCVCFFFVIEWHCVDFFFTKKLIKILILINFYLKKTQKIWFKYKITSFIDTNSWTKGWQNTDNKWERNIFFYKHEKKKNGKSQLTCLNTHAKLISWQ